MNLEKILSDIDDYIDAERSWLDQHPFAEMCTGKIVALEWVKAQLEALEDVEGLEDVEALRCRKEERTPCGLPKGHDGECYG